MNKIDSVSHNNQVSDVNKVLTDTYRLLAMTLVTSAICALFAMWVEISHITALVMMLASFVVLFVVHKKADKASGLLWVFVFTGLLGGALGPMLTHYLSMSNGAIMITQALAGTAIIFFSLSAYAVKSKKDFSFMGGMLMAGLVVVIIAMISNLFLQIPLLSIVISSVVILIMSGFILFDTSAIIHGGERNYIIATVSMYLNLYNIFIHLLSLIGVLGGDD